MKFEVLRATVFFLVLLCLASAPSKVLGGWPGALKMQPQAGGPGEDPWRPGDGGDNLPRQNSQGSHYPASVREVMGEATPSSRSSSKAMAKPPLGSSKQTPPRKPRMLLMQPSRSRSPRLKGHGKFNGDTYSCHSIQSRPCQKPSDCGGCLGLYTCKLPTGTCNLKAVSRQRDRFLQSIQSPDGRRVLLIP